jgi:hypothetical protein
MEAGPLLAGAIALIAIAMVHRTDKGAPAPALATLAPVLAVLPPAAALAALMVVWIILLAPILAAEIASASPRLAIVARLLRLVHSFIHSSNL